MTLVTMTHTPTSPPLPIIDHLPEGKLVIARRPLPLVEGGQPAEIILCYLVHNPVTPWVTWQHNIPENGGDGSCYWGHYFSPFEGEAAARLDFHSRGR